MNQIKASGRKPKRQVKARNKAEDSFQKEWQRVQKLQSRNEAIVQEIDNFYQEFLQEIKKSEISLVEITFSLTQRLIGHVCKKTLPQYLRVTLDEWITELLDELHVRPFAESLPLQDLVDQFNAQIEAANEAEQQRMHKKLEKRGFSAEQIDEVTSFMDKLMSGADEAELRKHNEDLFDDLFSEFASDDEDEFDDVFEEDLFREYFEEQARQKEAKEVELDKLLKATPVNTLFRKIARALHPDLEQDPVAKVEKHHLMSRLIKARDDKDIPTILGYYQQYVGDLPEGFFAGNFDKLTTLLKHQAQKLIEMKSQIISEAGVKGRLYERYKGASPAATRKKIQGYITDNQKLTKTRKLLFGASKTLADVRPVLENRFERFGNIPF